jgi:hypothetical protein
VSIDAQVDAALADGFEIVQQGRVLIAYDPARRPKLDFAQRVEGCNAGAIGSGDRLFDDDERWVHLRRRPTA